MRVREVEDGFWIRFEIGEKLPEALTEFCRARGVSAATASGLGALADPVLGYFDPETRAYARTELTGSWELLALSANVSLREGEPFTHAHVVLSGPDGTTRGGHLFEATVSVTAEIRLWAISRPLRRRMDPEFRLHFLDL